MSCPVKRCRADVPEEGPARVDRLSYSANLQNKTSPCKRARLDRLFYGYANLQNHSEDARPPGSPAIVRQQKSPDSLGLLSFVACRLVSGSIPCRL